MFNQAVHFRFNSQRRVCALPCIFGLSRHLRGCVPHHLADAARSCVFWRSRLARRHQPQLCRRVTRHQLFVLGADGLHLTPHRRLLNERPTEQHRALATRLRNLCSNAINLRGSLLTVQ